MSKIVVDPELHRIAHFANFNEQMQTTYQSRAIFRESIFLL